MIPLDKYSFWLGMFQYGVPLLVAIVTIIPTIISNRKKTQESLNAFKEEIKKDIDSTKQDVNSVKQALDKHIKEDEEDKARQARIRILRFYDEVCEGKQHSENHFEDIMDDIDDYEAYCSTHEEFRNNRGKAAMEHIEATYKAVKAKGGFLTYKPEKA